MPWILLLIAGLLEVGWAIGLKYTEGFTKPVPSVLTLAARAGSVVLLGIAMKSLPVGTSYAVWVGVGAVGTAILGMILFQAGVVGVMGYGIGLGFSALFFELMERSGQADLRGMWVPWQVASIAAGAVGLIIVVASLLSLRRVLVLEPAMVFK